APRRPGGGERRRGGAYPRARREVADRIGRCRSGVRACDRRVSRADKDHLILAFPAPLFPLRVEVRILAEMIGGDHHRAGGRQLGMLGSLDGGTVLKSGGPLSFPAGWLADPEAL